MRRLFFLLYIIACSPSFAQEESTPPPPPPPPLSSNSSYKHDTAYSRSSTGDTIYDLVAIEEMPEFPGGDAALMKFIQKEVIYPDVAKENMVQGKVFTSFIVDKTGEVINAEIYKGVKIPKEMLDKYKDDGKQLAIYNDAVSALNNEALRVINGMPKWKPGRQKGKNVKVRFILPFNFKLT